MPNLQKKRSKMRKRFARVSVDLRLEVETETGSLHTRARNLSAKGVMFSSEGKLVPGQQVHVLITFPAAARSTSSKLKGRSSGCVAKKTAALLSVPPSRGLPQVTSGA